MKLRKYKGEWICDFDFELVKKGCINGDITPVKLSDYQFEKDQSEEENDDMAFKCTHGCSADNYDTGFGCIPRSGCVSIPGTYSYAKIRQCFCTGNKTLINFQCKNNSKIIESHIIENNSCPDC
jgi:hypothetical protein